MSALTFFLLLLGLLHFFEALSEGTLPILLWVFTGVLLAQAHQQLFREDFESGTLELLYTSSTGFDRYLAAKILAQTGFLALIFAILIGGLVLGGVLSPSFFPAMGLALPPLTLLSTLLSVLLLNGKGQNLMPLLALPLFFPLTILGMIATTSDPQDAALALKILGALTFLFVPILFLALKRILIEKIMIS